MFSNLKGRNIIVTGCNGLIGSKLCEELLRHGTNIFGIDFTNTKNIDKQFFFYKCDLTLEKNVNTIIDDIYKKVDNINCLIHLAGIDYKVLESVKNEKLVHNFDTLSDPYKVMKSVNSNISMLYNTIYSVLSKFLDQSESRIILMGSIYGSYSPNPNLYINQNETFFYQKPIEYSISKSVFPTLTKYLCCHYAKKGLIVNNLEPHAIISNPDNKFINNFKKLSPMKRICNIDEIIEFIIYLIISKCKYLNGETIKIDGGWSTY